jgi:elongation factor P
MEGEYVVLMDNATYEQVHVPSVMLGDGIEFLKEGMEVKVTFEEDDAILAEPPTFVELLVDYAEPGVKGDTATNTLKPCKLETGAEIMVPLFISEGELIKIDTRTRQYVERVKK